MPREIVILVKGINFVSAGSFGLCKDIETSLGLCFVASEMYLCTSSALLSTMTVSECLELVDFINKGALFVENTRFRTPFLSNLSVTSPLNVYPRLDPALYNFF